MDKRIEALSKRKVLNRAIVKINNADLSAGSPMYYYCNMCGAETDCLPENYSGSPRKHCDLCQDMINDGWSEHKQRFITYENVSCPRCNGSGLGVYDYYMKRRRKCSRCNGNRTIKQRVE